MTEKNKATLLQSAVDAARRIIKPMTKEEEYKNADVPIPKAHKNFDEWLVTGLTDNVDDLKSKRKDNSPYEISLKIFELYSKIGRYFIEKNSLTFFMGGDNYMVVASDDAKNSVQNFIDLIKNNDNISLNCGIGNAQTSRDAVKLATKSLDTIRDIRDSGKQKPDVYEL